MGFHHVALATNDLEATHRFYTEVMGFSLAKAVVGETPKGGWAKHVFYDTGDGTCIAFWELHDASIAPFNPSISEALGLPAWVNHLAFSAADLDDLEAHKQRLLDHGEIVVEIDHGFCRSIYVTDPNKVLVEFCVTTTALDAADAAEAARLLADPAPPIDPPPAAVIHGLPAPAPAPAPEPAPASS
jgi:catechol 2,3-dioxygenase-like lactoylglutathione lyase family enzyme